MSGLPLFTELAGKSVLGNPGDDFVKRAGNQPSPFLFTSLFPCKSRDLLGALGRTRTCGLLIRSHSPSRTGRDSGGQGETKQRFYQVLALLEGQGGTGRDTRLRSDCGQNLGLSKRILEPEARLPRIALLGS